MNKTKWLFQTADGLNVHPGSATDSRGLKLREACGYTHVRIDGSWLQITVAIRKLACAERVAALSM